VTPPPAEAAPPQKRRSAEAQKVELSKWSGLISKAKLVFN